ncbi:MAG: 50S ribosomal protein L5 [Candidatus Bathyarchaeota archaeon]|nr:50S ribosomal protein L5 [Candidatus Bathyarchaeota archaeon]
MSEEEEIRKKWREIPMLKPKIRKVTINMAVGQSGEPLEKAVQVLEQLTGRKPVKRKAKQTIRDFGIRKGEPISCVVTLRKEKAIEFLTKTLQAVDNKIPKKRFDKNGNFSFGIREHIEIPGTKYTPELGIFGMDISVTLGRAGYRVKERRRTRSTIGTNHLLTPEEAMVFIKDTLAVEMT